MQKPAFYAIVGACLLVTAVSLGYSASRYLSARYYAPPPPPPAGKDVSQENQAPALPPGKWTNIFAPSGGMEIPSRVMEKGLGPVKVSTTPFVLLGTISSESPAARRAILWAEGMKEPSMVREQAEIEPGIRVVGIERDHVWIARGLGMEKLDLLPVGSRTRSAPAAPPAAPPAAARASRTPAPANSTINVTKIGENAFSLDEATVTELTGNINQFMTQVRIVPYFEENKSAGYRLAAVRPGSAFAQLGFLGGDVIQRVNDVELTTPEKMYTIFQNLKDEKHVTVDILRQGQKSTLTYEIR